MLIKPDAFARGLVGDIITQIERRGFRFSVARAEMGATAVDRLARHYAEHKDKPFYPELMRFMCWGPVLAVVVGGPPGTVAAVRGIAKEIRLARTTGAGPANLIHASDSNVAAVREVRTWFPDFPADLLADQERAAAGT